MMDSMMDTQMEDVKILPLLGQGKTNQLGGTYINGRPLNHQIREAIVAMYRQGEKPCKISRRLKVSHGAVSKILNRFNATGSIQPGQIGGTCRTRKTVVQFEKEILAMKEATPDIQPREIRANLIAIGLCTRENAPTESSIARRLTNFRRSGLLGRRSTPNPGCGSNSSTTASSPASPAAPSLLNGPPPPKSLYYSIEHILGTINSTTASNSHASLSPEETSWTDEDDANATTASSPNENRRNRTSFTAEQIKILESRFAANTYPSEAEKQDIIKETKLDLNRINTWFSNRRARVRKSCGYVIPNETPLPVAQSMPSFFSQPGALPPPPPGMPGSPQLPLFPTHPFLFPPISPQTAFMLLAKQFQHS